MHLNRRTITVAASLLPMLILASQPAKAADQPLKISVANLPALAESKDKGILINLLKAMEQASDRPYNIVVQPFARSIADAADGRADAHIPLLQPQGGPKSTDKFNYSSELLYRVSFVLYSKKGSSISKDNLKSAKIETDLAHTSYFDFPTVGSSDLLLSLKKVEAGRIDGVVFADSVLDPVVKANALTGLSRSLYKEFDVKFVLPKGGNGGPTDQALTAAIRKLKSNGQWAKLVEVVGRPYDNWQP